jgi:hypothetical protein
MLFPPRRVSGIVEDTALKMPKMEMYLMNPVNESG